MKLFARPGPANTAETLRIAVEVAHERGLCLVVASTRGDTAKSALAAATAAGVRLIVVTHNTGFDQPGHQEFDPEVRAAVEQRGGAVLTSTLALRGVGTAIRKKLGSSEEEIVNSTLRLFGQGTKVCVEMAAMTADAGLVSTDQDLVAVAGTAQGADTAWVLRPMPSNRFFDLRVRELLCKPEDF